jgi:microcystin synthetase protein McyB
MNKNIQAIYPLTPMQEGMLYHTIEMPNADIYFQQFACVIEGLHDHKKWRNSWQRVTENHAIMRTLFTWENRPQPLQVVRDHVTIPWTELDWSADSPVQQAEKWASFTQRDRDLNFDMASAPLARITMVNLGENKHQFLFSFHHILLDGWSQRLLLDEAVAYYNGNEPTLAPSQTTYSDFIDWLKHQDKSKANAFWTEYLAGFEEPTNIVNDSAVDAGNTVGNNKNQDNRHRQAIHIAPELVDKLKEQTKQHRLTLNTLFLGAWSLILSAHNNTQDVLFGTTVAGRPTDLPHGDKIAGLFINTLPFRAQVNGEETLANWLTSLQSSQAACRQFEQTALTDIQRCASQNTSSALIESILVVENLTSVKAENTQSEITLSKPSYTEFSHYPLAILVDPSDGLEIIALHQESKLSRTRISEVLQQIETVLNQMSESLDQAVSSIATLPAAAAKQHLLDWNNTQRSFSDVRPVHQLIEQFAAQTPSKIALIDTSAEHTIELTYEELNNKANQLAAHLLSKSLPSSVIVPVLIERSANALIAFLAVLKTGCAYIPLDSKQPASRNTDILSTLDTDNIWVISQKNLANKLVAPADVFINLTLVDEEQQAIAIHDTHNINIEVPLSQLAYVIYTSGSTGLPKGVMIAHEALANSTLARNEFYPSPPSTFLLMSVLSTDSAIAGLYWTLCTGNTLVLPKKRIEQDMLALGKIIKEYSVSHTLLIPSLYELILENVEVKQLSSLEAVIVAGESCTQSVVQKHQANLPDARLYNEYGPSECCVWASAVCLSDSNDLVNVQQRVSIGSPIANTQNYVLDKHTNAVLPEVVGELYIGGDNLAKGYLHDSVKTASSFIEKSFSNQPIAERNSHGNSHNNSPTILSDTHLAKSMRLYKTGDLVKYTANGDLIYVGRADNQVKVRGFRIEPEEIEYSLASLPMVKEVLVYAQTPPVSDDDLLTALVALPHEDANALLSETSSQNLNKNGKTPI